MGPAVSNPTYVGSAARVVMGAGSLPWLVRGFPGPTPAWNPGNPTGNRDPERPTAIAYMGPENVGRSLAEIAVDLLKQLEELKAKPVLYKAMVSYYLGRGRFLSIDSVKCETLYRGSTLAVYVVEVEGGGPVAESGGKS